MPDMTGSWAVSSGPDLGPLPPSLDARPNAAAADVTGARMAGLRAGGSTAADSTAQQPLHLPRPATSPVDAPGLCLHADLSELASTSMQRPTSPTGPAADAGGLKPLVPQASRNPSPLSPDVVPFHPDYFSGRRTKSRRWANDEEEEADDDNRTSYLDAVHPAKPVVAYPTRAQTRLVVTRGRGVVDAERQEPGRRRRRCSRPRP